MEPNATLYPSNSDSSKAERISPGVPVQNGASASTKAATPPPSTTKNLKPVAKASAKKKSRFEKAAKSVSAVDGASMKNFVVDEVLIPTFKDTFFRIITDGLSLILFGSTGNGARLSNRFAGGGARVSYNGFWNGGTRPESRADRYGRRRSVEPEEDLVFPSRADAEAVIDTLADVIDQYGVATMADLYDLAQVTAPYTYNRYGWRSVQGFDVRHSRDGWVIIYPNASSI